MTSFTTTFQIGYLAWGFVVFGFLAAVTSAPRRRVLGALASVAVFTALSAPIDLLAVDQGWWVYPSCVDPPHPPPLVYAGQALIFVGGVALVGARVERRWGARGLAVFAVLVCALGLVRDFAGAAFMPRIIRFGPAPAAQLADLGAWAVVVVVGLRVTRLVAGAPGGGSGAR